MLSAQDQSSGALLEDVTAKVGRHFVWLRLEDTESQCLLRMGRLMVPPIVLPIGRQHVVARLAGLLSCAPRRAEELLNSEDLCRMDAGIAVLAQAFDRLAARIDDMALAVKGDDPNPPCLLLDLPDPPHPAVVAAFTRLLTDWNVSSLESLEIPSPAEMPSPLDPDPADAEEMADLPIRPVLATIARPAREGEIGYTPPDSGFVPWLAFLAALAFVGLSVFLYLSMTSVGSRLDSVTLELQRIRSDRLANGSGSPGNVGETPRITLPPINLTDPRVMRSFTGPAPSNTRTPSAPVPHLGSLALPPAVVPGPSEPERYAKVPGVRGEKPSPVPLPLLPPLRVPKASRETLSPVSAPAVPELIPMPNTLRPVASRNGGADLPPAPDVEAMPILRSVPAAGVDPLSHPSLPSLDLPDIAPHDGSAVLEALHAQPHVDLSAMPDPGPDPRPELTDRHDLRPAGPADLPPAWHVRPVRRPGRSGHVADVQRKDAVRAPTTGARSSATISLPEVAPIVDPGPDPQDTASTGSNVSRLTFDEAISKAAARSFTVGAALARRSASSATARNAFLPYQFRWGLGGSFWTTGSVASSSGSIATSNLGLFGEKQFDFSGRRRDLKRIQVSVQQAGDASIDTARRESAYLTGVQFLTAVAAAGIQDGARELLEAARQNYRVARVRYDEGKAARIDALEAANHVVEARTAWVTAQADRQKAEIKLAQLTRADDAARVAPAPSNPHWVSQTAEQVFQMPVEKLARERSEVRQAAATVRERQARLDLSRKSQRPTFSTFSSLSIINGRRTGLTPALGVALSVPFGDGGEHETLIQEAQAVLDEGTVLYQQALETASAEIRTAQVDVRQTREIDQNKFAGVVTAREAMRVARDRYAGGYGSFTDLVTAYVALAAALHAQVDAERAALRAQIDLLRACGRLDRSGPGSPSGPA